MKKIQKSFSFGADLNSRSVALGALPEAAILCWLDGCADAERIAEDILRPLTRLRCRRVNDAREEILSGGVYSAVVRERRTVSELCGDLTAGWAVLLLPGGALLSFEVKSDIGRGVEPPTVEKAVLGARDSFSEALRLNTALVRRRIHSPELCLREFTAGRQSRTRVALFSMPNADPALTEAAARALETADTDSLLSAGDLESLLVSPPGSLFPRVLHTERPDRFARELLAGRVGILCDGLPVGFVLPGTLPEMMHATEDRARHAVLASFLLLLRWGALLLSLLLPALYAAVALYHQEMLPYALLQSIIRSKQEVPFSTVTEILGMLLSFELLQEAGLRLPETVGQTASIIGALIVGQSAVEARVISPIAVIVVAMAGIGGYALPSQELGAALRLWRLVLVGFAFALGMYGIAAGCTLLLWRLCRMESFGTAYLHPLCDRAKGDLRRVFLRRSPGKEDAP